MRLRKPGSEGKCLLMCGEPIVNYGGPAALFTHDSDANNIQVI